MIFVRHFWGCDLRVNKPQNFKGSECKDRRLREAHTMRVALGSSTCE